MMAGSYNHAVNEHGRLHNWRNMTIATETQGDAYETIEEMYGMIWYLAEGDPARVEQARQYYKDGLAMSPGKEAEPRRPPNEEERVYRRPGLSGLLGL